MSKTPYSIEVGRRLRAIAREFGCPTAVDLAAVVGAERPAVNTWFTGTALAPVPYMVKLCEEWNLTLDYIYRGKWLGISPQAYLRIEADLSGVVPPSDVAADPAPVPEEEPAAPAKISRSRRGAKAAASGSHGAS